MKKIGIVGWKVGDNSFGVTAPYYNFFSNFGNVRVLSPNDEFHEDLDLLVLPGGKDVDTSRYLKGHERLHLSVGNPDPFLEYFDRNMLKQYIESKTPIFGVCRGLQSINCFFNVRLHQDCLMKHPHYSTESRDELVHEVEFKYDDQYYTQEVNSLHHQAIKDLGNDLEIIGKTIYPASKKQNKTTYGTIEAIRHKDLPIYCVQFHPEELYDHFSIETIKNLLKIKNNKEVKILN